MNLADFHMEIECIIRILIIINFIFDRRNIC